MRLDQFNKRWNRLQANLIDCGFVDYTCNLVKVFLGSDALEEYEKTMSEDEGWRVEVAQMYSGETYGVSPCEIRFMTLENFYWHVRQNRLYKGCK